jgi:hypothetical protein
MMDGMIDDALMAYRSQKVLLETRMMMMASSGVDPAAVITWDRLVVSVKVSMKRVYLFSISPQATIAAKL